MRLHQLPFGCLVFLWCFLGFLFSLYVKFVERKINGDKWVQALQVTVSCTCVCVCVWQRWCFRSGSFAVTVHWAADSQRQIIGYRQVSVWLTAGFFFKGSFPLYNSSTVSFLPHRGPSPSPLILLLSLSITHRLMNGPQPLKFNPLGALSRHTLSVNCAGVWHELYTFTLVEMQGGCPHPLCTYTYTPMHTHNHPLVASFPQISYYNQPPLSFSLLVD